MSDVVPSGPEAPRPLRPGLTPGLRPAVRPGLGGVRRSPERPLGEAERDGYPIDDVWLRQAPGGIFRLRRRQGDAWLERPITRRDAELWRHVADRARRSTPFEYSDGDERGNRINDILVDLEADTQLIVDPHLYWHTLPRSPIETRFLRLNRADHRFESRHPRGLAQPLTARQLLMLSAYMQAEGPLTDAALVSSIYGESLGVASVRAEAATLKSVFHDEPGLTAVLTGDGGVGRAVLPLRQFDLAHVEGEPTLRAIRTSRSGWLDLPDEDFLLLGLLAVTGPTNARNALAAVNMSNAGMGRLNQRLLDARAGIHLRVDDRGVLAAIDNETGAIVRGTVDRSFVAVDLTDDSRAVGQVLGPLFAVDVQLRTDSVDRQDLYAGMGLEREEERWYLARERGDGEARVTQRVEIAAETAELWHALAQNGHSGTRLVDRNRAGLAEDAVAALRSALDQFDDPPYVIPLSEDSTHWRLVEHRVMTNDSFRLDFAQNLVTRMEEHAPVSAPVSIDTGLALTLAPLLRGPVRDATGDTTEIRRLDRFFSDNPTLMATAFRAGDTAHLEPLTKFAFGDLDPDPVRRTLSSRQDAEVLSGRRYAAVQRLAHRHVLTDAQFLQSLQDEQALGTFGYHVSLLQRTLRAESELVRVSNTRDRVVMYSGPEPEWVADEIREAQHHDEQRRLASRRSVALDEIEFDLSRLHLSGNTFVRVDEQGLTVDSTEGTPQAIALWQRLRPTFHDNASDSIPFVYRTPEYSGLQIARNDLADVFQTLKFSAMLYSVRNEGRLVLLEVPRITLGGGELHPFTRELLLPDGPQQLSPAEVAHLVAQPPGIARDAASIARIVVGDAAQVTKAVRLLGATTRNIRRLAPGLASISVDGGTENNVTADNRFGSREAGPFKRMGVEGTVNPFLLKRSGGEGRRLDGDTFYVVSQLTALPPGDNLTEEELSARIFGVDDGKATVAMIRRAQRILSEVLESETVFVSAEPSSPAPPTVATLPALTRPFVIDGTNVVLEQHPASLNKRHITWLPQGADPSIPGFTDADLVIAERVLRQPNRWIEVVDNSLPNRLERAFRHVPTTLKFQGPPGGNGYLRARRLERTKLGTIAFSPLDSTVTVPGREVPLPVSTTLGDYLTLLGRNANKTVRKSVMSAELSPPLELESFWDELAAEAKTVFALDDSVFLDNVIGVGTRALVLQPFEGERFSGTIHPPKIIKGDASVEVDDPRTYLTMQLLRSDTSVPFKSLYPTVVGRPTMTDNGRRLLRERAAAVLADLGTADTLRYDAKGLTLHVAEVPELVEATGARQPDRVIEVGGVILRFERSDSDVEGYRLMMGRIAGDRMPPTMTEEILERIVLASQRFGEWQPELNHTFVHALQEYLRNEPGIIDVQTMLRFSRFTNVEPFEIGSLRYRKGKVLDTRTSKESELETTPALLLGAIAHRTNHRMNRDALLSRILPPGYTDVERRAMEGAARKALKPDPFVVLDTLALDDYRIGTLRDFEGSFASGRVDGLMVTIGDVERKAMNDRTFRVLELMKDLDPIEHARMLLHVFGGSTLQRHYTQLINEVNREMVRFDRPDVQLRTDLERLQLQELVAAQRPRSRNIDPRPAYVRSEEYVKTADIILVNHSQGFSQVVPRRFGHAASNLPTLTDRGVQTYLYVMAHRGERVRVSDALRDLGRAEDDVQARLFIGQLETVMQCLGAINAPHLLDAPAAAYPLRRAFVLAEFHEFDALGGRVDPATMQLIEPDGTASALSPRDVLMLMGMRTAEDLPDDEDRGVADGGELDDGDTDGGLRIRLD